MRLEDDVAYSAAWDRVGFRIYYQRALEANLYSNYLDCMNDRFGNLARGLSLHFGGQAI